MDKQKLETIAKWGLGLGAIGVGGVVAGFLLHSLVMIAALGLVALAVVNFTPVIADKFATWKLKAIKHNAMVNPVEALQLIYMEKERTLQKMIESIKAFATATKNYGAKVEEFKQKRPNKAADFENTYVKMKRILDVQTKKANDATHKLGEFQAVIEEGQDIWVMSQEARKANELMGRFEKSDPMQDIKEKTALDSIQNSLNSIMADLEVSLALTESDSDDALDKKLAALSNDSSPVLAENVTIKEKEAVK